MTAEIIQNFRNTGPKFKTTFIFFTNDWDSSLGQRLTFYLPQKIY